MHLRMLPCALIFCVKCDNGVHIGKKGGRKSAKLSLKPQVNCPNILKLTSSPGGKSFMVLIQSDLMSVHILRADAPFYSTDGVLSNYHRLIYMSTLSGKWVLLDFTVCAGDSSNESKNALKTITQITLLMCSWCLRIEFQSAIRYPACLQKTHTMAWIFTAVIIDFFAFTAERL